MSSHVTHQRAPPSLDIESDVVSSCCLRPDNPHRMSIPHPSFLLIEQDSNRDLNLV